MNLRYAQLARPMLAQAPWRAVAAWLVVVASLVGTVLAVMLVLAPTGLFEAFLSAPDDYAAFSPALLATTLLLVPIFYFPATAITAWCVLGMSPRQVCSVTGRFRWGFYGRCLAVSVIVVLALQVVVLPWTGLPEPAPTAQWPLLIVALCGIALAAFTEEFAFRGVLTHLMGAWWGRRVWAVAASALPTSALFALAHGAFEPVLFLTFVVGGLAYSVVCDQTGGLEASAAAHAAFNTIAFTSALLFVPSTSGSSGYLGLVPLILSEAVLVVAMVVLARRRGIAVTTSDPTARPAAAPLASERS